MNGGSSNSAIKLDHTGGDRHILNSPLVGDIYQELDKRIKITLSKYWTYHPNSGETSLAMMWTIPPKFGDPKFGELGR